MKTIISYILVPILAGLVLAFALLTYGHRPVGLDDTDTLNPNQTQNQ